MSFVRIQGSNAFKVGTSLGATTDAAQLSSTNYYCNEVYLENDPSNAVNILWGSSDGQPFKLAPGGSVSIPVQNVALVYVKTASSTATVPWAAFQ